MKTPSQKSIWDAIAPEWYEFKKIPSELSKKFLKKCSGKVLDLGSVSGRHLLKFKKEIELKTKNKFPKRKMYLIDFSKEMLKLAKEKAQKKKISAEFIQSNLSKLPFENNFFDYAICTHSLYCIPNKKSREKAVQERYRVLKFKAKTIISMWDKNSKRFIKRPKEIFINWQNKGKRYYYLFDEKEIYNLFKSRGFKIIWKDKPREMIVFVVEKI